MRALPLLVYVAHADLAKDTFDGGGLTHKSW
jgi:hypothetical protein